MRRGIVIGDGALGTQLQALTKRAHALPESLNLDPSGQALLRGIHAEYVRAGSQIIETNTFAANPIRLEAHGLADRCEEIVARAAAVAREAAGADVLLAGSVGPLDLGLAAKDLPPDAMAAAYRRQIGALREHGVDLIMLETFSSPLEARLALTEARTIGLPIFFALGGQAVCRPYARRTVLELIELANEFQVQALGINCVAPYDLTQLLPVLLDHTQLPLLAYPNAGTPVVARGAVQYDLPVDVLLAEAEIWRQRGVAVFGGCCGTGPEHIRALAAKFGGQPVQARPQAAPPAAPSGARPHAPAAAAARDAANPIRRLLHANVRPLIAVEVKPALNRTLEETAETMRAVIEAGADLLDVPDNAGANPGRDCMACAFVLQRRYSIPAIIHKTATQTNALHAHSYLLGAADLGIRGVLAVTGDSPHIGTFDRLASRVNDIRNSVELLRLIGLLRQGMLINGQPLPRPVDFAAGCAVALTQPLQRQIQWLRKKAEAGAEFVFTQPVFAPEDYRRLRDACREFSLPFFIGVLPLVSAKQAAFLQSGKIPGIAVPAAVVERLASFPDPADQVKAGMELCRALVLDLARECRGLYLIMPFHKQSPAITAELVRAIAADRRNG